MKLHFAHTLEAPRESVWDALLDPGVLARIIPGVERFEVVGEDTFEATLKVGLPAVKGEYKGRISIRNKVRDEAGRYSYVLEGAGDGVQGWARGDAKVELSPSATGTRLNVDADVQVGGRIAGVGQRMIEGVAKMMAEEFFAAFERELAGQRSAGGPIGFFLRAMLRALRRLFSGRAESEKT